MGYAPPDHINNRDEITKYYKAVKRIAPLHCFHCLGEGNMESNCPQLKRSPGAQPGGAAPVTRSMEGTNHPNAQRQAKTPPLTREGMNTAFKQQIDGMEQRMLEAVRKMLNPNSINNPNMSRGNQAKAVRSSGDVNVETERVNSELNMEKTEPGFLPQGSMNNQSDWPSYGRQDHLKILKLADKKQLSLLECGGHQITKELECESNQSVIHIDIYVDYFRQKGHDVDRKALAKSLKARRRAAVCLKDKERQAFGPVQIGLKIDFIEIINTAWVILDDDLIRQIFIGRNELSLRAVGPATGVRSAVIDNNATMTVRVHDSHGDPVELRGMLETGAGISVISANAWAVPLDGMDGTHKDGE